MIREIPANFKVVCVKNYNDGRTEKAPAKDQVYTVRQIVIWPRGDVGYRLQEIVNKPKIYIEGVVECSFKIDNFRLLDDGFTDAVESMVQKFADRIQTVEKILSFQW